MIALLDIEKRLYGDGREVALTEYDRQLVRLEERLKTSMDQGLSPDDFSNADALKSAVRLARKLIRLSPKGQD
ncbi:MAG: hypothetical protein MJ202_09635 [Lentisphaeria bacterium]|nr:hypothetical protein [Lentisphaeria bacterium]